MKSRYFLCALLCVGIVACQPHDKQTRKDKSGQKKDTVVDSLQAHVVKEYYSNGVIKNEISARGSKREGTTKVFDRQGRLLSEVNYINNTREGMAKNYYPGTGKINSTLVYKKGIKDGDEIWYFESGKPFRVTPYVQGIISGVQKFYYEDGKIMASIPYKKGNPGTGLKEYKKDGSLITDYPRLIIKQNDHLKDANKVIVSIEMSDSYAQVKFYEGALDEGKYLSDKQFELSTQFGISQIDFNVAPGASLHKTIIITANYKSKYGNPLVLSRTFTVSATNNK
jgi:antitoxin component YwqK of YwqJK toxin-antitoxin module